MIRCRIVKDCSKYERAYGFNETDHVKSIIHQSLKERMCINAIHYNGMCKTFCFSENCYDLILNYIKIEDKDIELYPDMFEKRSYFRLIYPCDNQTDQSLYNPCNSLEFQDIMSSCSLYNVTNEIDDTLNREFEKIKKECVEKYNAVYSSVKLDYIEINREHEIISIHYTYYYIKDEFIDKISSYDVIFGKAPLPYAEWFNIVLTNDIEKSLKNKVKVNTNYSENVIKELKENKNMKIHLFIVPEEMNEESVKREEKHTCENCRNNEGEPNPFDTCNNCHNGSEYEEKTSKTCKTCRDQFRHDGSQHCISCNNYCSWRPKLSTQENLMETLMFLKAKNEQLEYKLAQCKEEKQEIPGYCMDCKNFKYTARYDNNTKKGHIIDFCNHWSKEDNDGNTIFAETVADGYCYMFEPKNDGTGTWTYGICSNCGYDWSKDAPTARVPKYCPKCGQKKKIKG